MTKFRAVDCGDYNILPSYLIKYLNCRNCLKVMAKPVRLAPCAHTFCQVCVSTSRCPLCKEQWQLKQLDLTAAGLAGELTVRCNAEGCPFSGTMDEYISQHKDKCHIKKYGGLRQWQEQMKQSIQEISSLGEPQQSIIDIASQPANTKIYVQIQEESEIDYDDLILQKHQTELPTQTKPSKSKLYDIQGEQAVSYRSRIPKKSSNHVTPDTRRFVTNYFKNPMHRREMRKEQAQRLRQKVIEL